MGTVTIWKRLEIYHFALFTIPLFLYHRLSTCSRDTSDRIGLRAFVNEANEPELTER